MFRNILIPTDGSTLSDRAIKDGVALAKLVGAKITVLHIYPKFAGSPYGTFGPSEDILEEAHERQAKAEADKLFAKAARTAKDAGVEAETQLVQSDDVYNQIIATAKRRKCDLICMASHGRRGIAGVLLGSETQKVLTHSTVPVLVLR